MTGEDIEFWLDLPYGPLGHLTTEAISAALDGFILPCSQNSEWLGERPHGGG